MKDKKGSSNTLCQEQEGAGSKSVAHSLLSSALVASLVAGPGVIAFAEPGDTDAPESENPLIENKNSEQLAKERLDAAQKAFDKAKEEFESAKGALDGDKADEVKAKQALQAQQDKIAAAESELKAALAQLKVEAAKRVEATQVDLAKVQGQIEKLNGDISSATENSKKAEEDVTRLTAEIDGKDASALQAVVAEKTQLENQANSVLATAQDELKQAQDQLAKLREDKAAADARAAQAQDVLSQAQGAQAQASQEVQTAKLGLANAQKRKQDLETNLDKLKRDAQQAQAIASENKVTKEQTQAQAQEAFDRAQADLARAQQDYAAKKATLDEKRQEQQRAAAALESAVSRVNELTQAQTQAQEKLAQSQRAATQAQQEVEAAQAAKRAADEALERARAQVGNAKPVDAEAVRRQIAEKEAEKLRLNSSLGFFDAVGSKAAANLFNTTEHGRLSNGQSDPKAIKDYTHVGEADDATSLKSLKDAAAWVKKANELRALDENKFLNLRPLKMTDWLVAVAELNNNFAAENIAHATIVDRALALNGSLQGGENHAWGTSSSFNPFQGWYYQERDFLRAGFPDWNNDLIKEYFDHQFDRRYTGSALYQRFKQWLAAPNASHGNNESAVGHYLNIITPRYGVSGFASTTDSTVFAPRFPRANAFTESFDETPRRTVRSVSLEGETVNPSFPGKPIGDDDKSNRAFTADEYLARVVDYETNILPGSLSRVEEELAALRRSLETGSDDSEARANLAAAENAVKEKQDALARAEEAKRNADAVVERNRATAERADQDLNEAQGAKSQAENAKADADRAADAAQAPASEAEAAQTQAQEIQAQAQTNLNKAKADTQNAAEVLAAAQATLAKLNDGSAINEVEDKIKQAQADVAAKQSEFERANEALTAAERAKQEADQAVTSLPDQTSVQANIEAKEADVADKLEKVNQAHSATEEAKAAVGAFNAAVKNLEAARTAKDKADKDKQAAEVALEAAREAVTVAVAAHNAAVNVAASVDAVTDEVVLGKGELPEAVAGLRENHARYLALFVALPALENAATTAHAKVEATALEFAKAESAYKDSLTKLNAAMEDYKKFLPQPVSENKSDVGKKGGKHKSLPQTADPITAASLLALGVSGVCVAACARRGKSNN